MKVTALDLSAYIGLTAIGSATANMFLGVLMACRYSPVRQWPHRQFNYFRLPYLVWLRYSVGRNYSPRDSAVQSQACFYPRQHCLSGTLPEPTFGKHAGCCRVIRARGGHADVVFSSAARPTPMEVVSLRGLPGSSGRTPPQSADRARFDESRGLVRWRKDPGGSLSCCNRSSRLRAVASIAIGPESRASRLIWKSWWKNQFNRWRWPLLQCARRQRSGRCLCRGLRRSVRDIHRSEVSARRSDCSRTIPPPEFRGWRFR